MNRIAANFLTRSFASCETIALLLRREDAPRPQQRVVTVEQVLAPRYMAWLNFENDNGANIYVSANPLIAGSRKRTKECIASVRHIYIDIDADGDARLAALRASDLVPTPTAIISTSPGKYQALWRVAGFDFERQEQTLKLVAHAFGGDPACTDRNRVLRVPGFLNRKYSPVHPVAVEYPADAIYGPADFRLENIEVSSVLPLCGNTPKKPAHSTPLKHSHSEEDWAWVCAQLARDMDAAKLTRELALRRADKSDPLYYAQRTVDVASARLWLDQGTPINDVITMLEIRRRFEIPAALLQSRAQEIAATAQRMIARRKTALIHSPKESDMPLLEVTQTRHISASIRLTDTTALQVDQYAAFIHASADDVVEQALAYVFSKDRDFQEFLRTPEAQRITPTLRIRRVPASEAAETPSKPASKAAVAVGAKA